MLSEGNLYSYRLTNLRFLTGVLLLLFLEWDFTDFDLLSSLSILLLRLQLILLPQLSDYCCLLSLEIADFVM
jgi:hypothetical protein